MSRYTLCDRCTVRNCRRTPKDKGHGMYKCHKMRELRDGFPMLEVLLENSPVELLTLVHEHGGQITETKKGHRIKW